MSRNFRCNFRLLFFACLLTASSVGTASAAQKYVGFGDSITAGVPYVSGDQNGSTVDGYEPTLKDHLVGTGRDAVVLNYGHPGETSWEGDDRIQSVLNNENPDVVLVMEGTNSFAWVSTNSIMSDLASMANKVKNAGSIPILATITPDTRGGKPITEMNSKIRNWAADNDVPLADQYAAVAGNWNNLHSGDKLHPNREGYKIIAKTWFDTIIANSNPNIAPIIMLLLDD